MLCCASFSYGQKVRLTYTDIPLNDVLLEISQTYDLQVSINANLAAGCLVTVDEKFESAEAAMNYLAKTCNLQVVSIGGVYAFQSINEETVIAASKPIYLYQGKVRDTETGEPLPYAKIILPNGGVMADDQGNFSFKSTEKRIKSTWRYLGYTILDTVLTSSSNLSVSLVPRENNLQEVLVTSAEPRVELSTTGEGIGEVALNDVYSKLIPGNSTNLLFNHLRLYPGILAAGESLSEFVVWGAHMGQNQMIFDGITLFSGSGIDNNIGRVNPLLIKNIAVYKGGYNVHVGDRVGGIMLIDGRQGQTDKFRTQFNLNNQLANAYVNIPLFKGSSSLQVAGRQTFADFLKLEHVLGSNDERFIQPEYKYGDLNVKFTKTFKNNDFLELSTIFSRDTYTEEFTRKKGAQQEYQRFLQIGALQAGGALRYTHLWKLGGITKFAYSQSSFSGTHVSSIRFRPLNGTEIKKFGVQKWNNGIGEKSIKVNHEFTRKNKQEIDVSVGLVQNDYQFELDTNLAALKDANAAMGRLRIYGRDNIQITNRLKVQIGLKIEMPFNAVQLYPQPRVNGSFDLSENWKLNFGWGLYNQFVNQTAIIDTYGNRTHFWQLADGENSPVLSGQHNAIGLNYFTDKLEFGIEGYYKTTSGLTQYLVDSSNSVYERGEAIMYGIDLFAQKRWNQHLFTASYSLGQVMESFPSFGDEVYLNALHNQLHELKLAALFAFNPVYFSIVNVYGSGFEFKEGVDPSAYHRLDIALEYRKKWKAFGIETGFSILNLLNHKNVRLFRYTVFPDGELNSTIGTEFTPLVYLNLKLN